MKAIEIGRTWQRAIERAMRDGRKATKLSDGRYRVASKSHPGDVHYLTLDQHDHINHCSNCPWWARYGRSNPCGHAGAVALAVLYMGGYSIQVKERAA